MSKSLINALRTIKDISVIPQHKRHDPEFLNACCVIIHNYAKAVLDGEKVWNPYRDTPRDDYEPSGSLEDMARDT